MSFDRSSFMQARHACFLSPIHTADGGARFSLFSFFFLAHSNSLLHRMHAYHSSKGFKLWQLKELERDLAEKSANDRPPRNQHEKLIFSVEVGANSTRRWIEASVDQVTAHLRACLTRNQREFAHEFFTDMTRVKPFFDVDYMVPEDELMLDMEQERDVFINRLLGHLNRVTGLGASNDDWMVLECTRHRESANARKISFHVILNTGVYFANARAFGAFLGTLDLDWDGFCLDRKVYSHNKSLRAAGSLKRDEWDREEMLYMDDTRPPLFVPRKEHYETHECFVTWIPENYHEFVTEEGQRYQALNLPAPAQEHYGNVSQEQQALVDFMLERIRALTGNEDAVAFNVHAEDYPAFGTTKVCFSLRDAHRCSRCLHESDVMNGSIDTSSNTVFIACRGTDHSWEFGCTPETDYFLRLRAYLRVLNKIGLCRPDMLFTEADYGCRDLTPAKLFEKILNTQVPPEFVYYRALPGPGVVLFDDRYHMWLANTWSSHQMADMVVHMNCFLSYSVKAGIFVYNSGAGLSQEKKEQVLCIFPHVQFKVFKKVPKTDDEYVITWKPLFPEWLKHPQASRIMGPRYGEYFIGPVALLNFLPGKAVSTIAADRAYDEASSGDQEFVASLWKHMIEMLCLGEDAGVNRIQSASFLERWILTILFRVGYRTNVAVGLFSNTQGTGKSTLTDFICQILGDGLVVQPSDLGEFMTEKFNTSGNTHLVNADDALANINRQAFEVHIKSLITASHCSGNVKYGKNNVRMENVKNLIFSSNQNGQREIFVKGISSHGRNRRFFLLDVQEPSKIEETGLLNYNCDNCNGTCRHFYSNHVEFMDCWHDDLGKDPRMVLVMVGFLHKRFVQLEPQWITGTLQDCLPQTKLVLKIQQKLLTATEKWYDHCAERGYHWDFSNKPQESVEQWYCCSDLVPDDMGNVVNFEPRWLSKIPLQTLYKQFTRDMRALGLPIINSEDFLYDLKLICFARTSVELQLSTEAYSTFVYSRPNNLSGAFWQPVESRARGQVITMGPGPWEKVVNVVPLALRRSESRLARSLSNSQSNEPLDADGMLDWRAMGQQSPDVPPTFQVPDEAPSSSVPPRSALSRAMMAVQLQERALDEENPMNEYAGFEASESRRRAREGSDPEDDEDRIPDLDKRQKTSKNPFLVGEAVEAEEEEEEDPEEELENSRESTRSKESPTKRARQQSSSSLSFSDE